jgi:hypothetical protein
MPTIIDQINAIVNSLPSYFVKGIMDLFSATLGGLFVGWVGSTFFARKSQIAETQGELLKRKVTVYDELSQKLENLLSAQTISVSSDQVIQNLLKVLNIDQNNLTKGVVLSIFTDPTKFKDEFLSLDSYILSHRMYFDDNVMMSIMVLQSYMAALRRIQTLYEDQIIDKGVDLRAEGPYAIETNLMMVLGVLSEYDLSQLIGEVLDSVRQSMTDLKLSRHKNIPHDEKFFSNNGPIMDKLKDKYIFKEKESIYELVSRCIALALYSSKIE